GGASPPARGRGSKLESAEAIAHGYPSPPARGRGSKHGPRVPLARRRLSPPARGRGSKQESLGSFKPSAVVAPCAGAWIETRLKAICCDRRGGRPLRGGVDRNSEVKWADI